MCDFLCHFPMGGIPPIGTICGKQESANVRHLAYDCADVHPVTLWTLCNCLAPPRAAARIPANWRSCEARRLLAYQYGGTAVSWMSGAAAARRGTRSGEAAVAAASRSGTPCRQTPGGSLLQGHAPEEA